MTVSDLYDSALRKLGVLAAGETATTDDLAVCAEVFAQITCDLDIPKVVIVEGTGRHLTTILAMEMADDFQVEEARTQRLMAMYQHARRRVISLVHGSYDTDSVTEGDAY